MSSSFSLSWEVIASLWLHLLLTATIVLAERWMPQVEPPLFEDAQVINIELENWAYAPLRTKGCETAVPESTDPILENQGPLIVADPITETTPSPNLEVSPESSSKAVGSIISEKQSPPGKEGAALLRLQDADPTLQAYVRAIRESAWKHWFPLPTTIQAQPDLVVEVLLSVSREQSRWRVKIRTSSGDRGFDRSVQYAILKTPLLPYPDGVTYDEFNLILCFPASDKL